MKNSLHRKLTVICLFFLFLTNFLVRELHPFFAVEHQHVQKVCEETNQTHLHSADYAPEHCSFCAVYLAISDFSDIVYQFTLPIFTALSEVNTHYTTIFVALSFWQPDLRGPPQA
jgi:hypothetical protein